MGQKSHSLIIQRMTIAKKIPNRTITQVNFIVLQSYLYIDENSFQATLKLRCFHFLVDCKGRIHIWCMHEVFLSMFPMFWYLRAVTIAWATNGIAILNAYIYKQWPFRHGQIARHSHTLLYSNTHICVLKFQKSLKLWHVLKIL